MFCLCFNQGWQQTDGEERHEVSMLPGPNAPPTPPSFQIRHFSGAPLRKRLLNLCAHELANMQARDVVCTEEPEKAATQEESWEGW